MAMRWLLLGVLLAVITPVRIVTDVWHHAVTDVHARIYLWGVRMDLKLRILRENKDWKVLLLTRQGQFKELRAKPGLVRQSAVSLKTFLRSDKARRFLLRHVDVQALHAWLRLSLSNAARTAMLTGALQVLQGMLPPAVRKRVRIRIQPDFMQHETLLQARCIVFFRLGTLLMTVAMVLAAYWMERRASAPQKVKEA